MAGDNNIERYEQRLEKNKAQRAKFLKWLLVSVPLFWLTIYGLTWFVVIYISQTTSSGIQEVNVGIITTILISVSVATFAASAMNIPSYMIVRQLTHEIQADEIALRQARLVQDTILLQNTTHLNNEEIDGLLKDRQIEPQKNPKNKWNWWPKKPSWSLWGRKKSKAVTPPHTSSIP